MKKARASGGLVVVKRTKDGVVALKAAKGRRLTVSGDKRVKSTRQKETWAQTYRRLRLENLRSDPTPDGMSRREYAKLHHLPEPFRIPGLTPYRSMSRMWWDKLKRKHQIAFRKDYPEMYWRRLFLLNSNRR